MYKNKILAILISVIIFIIARNFYLDAIANLTPKSVSVRGYYRENGVYVKPYKRRPPYSVPHDKPFENIISLTTIIMFGCCIVTGVNAYLLYINSKNKNTNDNFINYSKKDSSVKVSTISINENNNEKLIQDAIEKKLLLSFEYTDNKGVKSARLINPTKFTYSYYGNKCIEGLCFLRKEKRNFTISKMVNVNIFYSNKP